MCLLEVLQLVSAWRVAAVYWLAGGYWWVEPVCWSAQECGLAEPGYWLAQGYSWEAPQWVVSWSWSRLAVVVGLALTLVWVVVCS